jgi:AcrR family transcriptional regulator
MALRPPLQNRSADTLNRIFEATERLLESMRFEELTIASIVKAADSSVGAFYARFPDKEALLDALDERYMEDALANLKLIFGAAAQPDQSTEAVVRTLVQGILGFHRRKPGLIRALVLRARTVPDRDYQRRGDAITSELFGRVTELLGPQARSERAVALGLFTVITVIREQVLFPEGPAKGIRIADDDLVEELTELFMRYIDPKEPIR